MKRKSIKIVLLLCVLILAIIAAIALTTVVQNRQRIKENTIFSIKEIILYNSANVIDNSNNPALTNLSISQYSDLSFFIDNSLENSELNDSNTIKELYIDNISITSKYENGQRILNYKSPLSFGKYTNLEMPEDDKINFRVIRTNAQNDTNDYTSPTFYTDCSNPITLGYLNKDIITDYSISSDTNIVSYNAKVLREANINLGNINNTVSFTIHLVNNANHKFSCNVNLNIALDNDFAENGYSYIKIPVDGDEYRFLRD